MTGTLKAQPRGATPRLRSGAEARRTPCPKGGGQEELPHVRGQGQWLRAPGCDGPGTAERSYPVSEVGGVAERSYPTSEVRGRGWEELPHAPTPEAGATAGRSNPRPRPGVEARRTNPTSKEPWLRRRRRA